MTVSLNEISELIQSSQKVLIGIGEEFSCNEIEISNSEVYKLYSKKKAAENEEIDVDWMIEPIRKNFLDSELEKEKLRTYKALENLFELVREKDYYIVSMNYDSILEKVGFNTSRIVYPCGSRKNYQCSKNCSNEVLDSKEIDDTIIEEILEQNIKLSKVNRPVCDKCGNVLVYNTVNSDNYCEAGYLDKWKVYTEWIATTLNKDICVLELGVSFRYPTVIRWPFEKISFVNNKARFVRINEKFNQVSLELTDKSITLKQNAINFLLH
jgi:NAD-dependent SIR2 family protein deacetylase